MRDVPIPNSSYLATTDAWRNPARSRESPLARPEFAKGLPELAKKLFCLNSSHKASDYALKHNKCIDA